MRPVSTVLLLRTFLCKLVWGSDRDGENLSVSFLPHQPLVEVKRVSTESRTQGLIEGFLHDEGSDDRKGFCTGHRSVWVSFPPTTMFRLPEILSPPVMRSRCPDSDGRTDWLASGRVIREERRSTETPV